MRLLCCLWLLHLAIGASAFSDPDDNLDEDEFLSEFGLDPIADPLEKERRSEALKVNEEIVKEENIEYTQGEKPWYAKINEFSDLPEDEFEKEKNGLLMDVEYGRGLIPLGPEDRDERSERYFDKFRYSRARIPSSYSSVERGNVSPVKNQIECGSCTAFATMATVEVCFKKLTGVFGDYSEQELVDCGYGPHAFGCRGALIYAYAKWIVKNKRRLTHEYSYPYLNVSPKLKCPKEKPFNQGARITNFSYTNRGTEELLKRLVYKHGAVIVAVTSDNWQNYGGGVLDSCNGNTLHDLRFGGTAHAVSVVGYGNDGRDDYWLIKNSWSARWGEKGYIRLKRGVGACAIGHHMATVSCETVQGPTNRPPAPPTTQHPLDACVERNPECPELAKFNCKKYGKRCIKSCGLCRGMTPHPSNLCSDNWPLSSGICQKMALTRCHDKKVAKSCCISCGLGPGMTPADSYCIDSYGQQECASRRNEYCSRKPEKCQRTCGLCNCKDKWAKCPKYAKKYCVLEKYKKGCCKSCGLGPGMTPAASNCVDVWPAATCSARRDKVCRKKKNLKFCMKTCGKC